MKTAATCKKDRGKRGWYLVIMALLLCGGLAFFFGFRFLAIDSCLDAGGRWNYEIEECER